MQRNSKNAIKHLKRIRIIKRTPGTVQITIYLQVAIKDRAMPEICSIMMNGRSSDETELNDVRFIWRGPKSTTSGGVLIEQHAEEVHQVPHQVMKRELKVQGEF